MFASSWTLVLPVTSIELGAIETTLPPQTRMRLDHFGHNYEFSVTALPDDEDVCLQLSSRSWLSSRPARLAANFPKSGGQALSPLRSTPARGRVAGPTPERASKRTRLGIAQRRCDIGQRKLRVIQQLASGLEANFI